LTAVESERPRQQGIEQVAEDVFRLPLPIPFPSQTANAYLLVDEPMVLIDVGPKMPGAVEALQGSLEEVGHDLADVGLILLTHPHVDHSGLAGALGAHTDAQLATLEQMSPFVEDYWELARRDEAFSLAALRRYGMPPKRIAEIQPVLHGERQWAAEGTVDRRLPDGGEVKLARRTLDVHFRPGHSPVDAVFHDADNGLLFGGDHLLERMSSNPSLWPPAVGRAEIEQRPRPLLEYRRSLLRTRELEVEVTLPGHGPPIAGHRKAIDDRLVAHERRVERLAEMLDDGPADAVELADRTWGRFAAAHPFRALCEIVIHMDLLVEAGAAREVVLGGRVRYEASEAGAAPERRG
jgi:glyoxylase-like metal-dependent hydrolase (beta-lactamase superfamily II)